MQEYAVFRYEEPRQLQLEYELIGKYEQPDVGIVQGTVNLITHEGISFLHPKGFSDL